MIVDAYSNLLVERSGSVLEITLDRPEVRNALDETLIEELTRCVNDAAQAGGVRALILRGAGNAFCAGADLRWMARAADYSYEENLQDSRTLQRLLAAIAEFPGATLAVAHGAAIGGGAGLVAACDIAIAQAHTTFAFSEVRLGLAPAVISPYVIDRIGAGTARRLFITGERFDASAALRFGLVDHVTDGMADSEEQVGNILSQILQAGPGAIAAAKLLTRKVSGKSAADAADLTAETIARLRVGAEGQEGIHAFLEKRKASFVESISVTEDRT